jgi:flagellar hook-associated protein 1
VSLSGVLNTARFALDAATAQTALVSRNIAGADQAGYVRKFAAPDLTSLSGNTIIRRAESPALFARATDAQSKSAAAAALAEGLGEMRGLFGGDERANAPTVRMDALRSALQAAAVDASDPVLASRAVDAAKQLAETVRSSATSVASMRNGIEERLGDEATRLNAMLASFETLNTRIVGGSRTGDVSDLKDQRDQLLRSMSEVTGIRATTRGNDDMVLQTESGVVLFETRARPVSYQSASPLTSGAPGGRFLVDGVPIAGPGAIMPVSSGTIAGLVAFRDGPAAELETRLDETARMLISAFSESDQSATPTKPDLPGLFTANGLSGLPATGVRVPGIAQRLEIAASVDPSKGGNVMLLRDGGISGDAAMRANTTNAAGFPDRLNALAKAFDVPLAADPSTGLGATRTVVEYAARGFGALEEARKAAGTNAETLGILKQRTEASLASETGVSLDAEMTRLLELERSYAASAKLITIVDQMYATLLGSVR